MLRKALHSAQPSFSSMPQVVTVTSVPFTGWGNRVAIALGVVGLAVAALILWCSSYRHVTTPGERADQGRD